MQCFETIRDFCSGDKQNQRTTCQNRALFAQINEKIILSDIDYFPEEKEKLYLFLPDNEEDEVNDEEKNHQQYKKEDDIQYNQVPESRKNQDQQFKKQKNSNILHILKNINNYEAQKKRNAFKEKQQIETQNNQKNFKKSSFFNISQILKQVFGFFFLLYILFYKIYIYIYIIYLDVIGVYKKNYFYKTDEFYKFYNRFTGKIEVLQQNEELTNVYFKKPFSCLFMTPNIQEHLVIKIKTNQKFQFILFLLKKKKIFKADRDNDQDRVKYLLINSKFYYSQMNRKQEITKNYPLISILANNWRFFKDLSYILVILITIITMVKQQHQEENDQANLVWDNSINLLFSISQLIISFIVVVCCAIERYPISIHLFVQSQNFQNIQNIRQISGFQKKNILNYYSRFMNIFQRQLTPENAKNNYLVRFILISLDFENIYNCIYFLLTVFAVTLSEHAMIYGFLLLDIIKKSEDLQNVISSITTNAYNLLQFAFLGVIIIYTYAILGFTYFSEYFDQEKGADASIFMFTITSTIKEGLRNGGGIADSLKFVDTKNDPKNLLWPRYFYDLTFFVIINMLFIQIIFGIILDTFGSLRNERQNLLSLINEICFICGQTRAHIDAYNKKGWHHHICCEHNIYNMLYYIIYVSNKNNNECDGLESYIKEQIQENNINFIPIQRSIQEELQKNLQKQNDKQD
ncbi:hypothetical protein IMG5_062440 [Ichthyophthirius multifiliis]|uniref:Ion transport domain-containing protein n=1 Tax=Ichthyophthirius multifiliis TaxID=5932 RepID=G0QNX9_ICHMU|nr:hypothetical protein IMG5_062440 [Ichthyophthirius multifiliis]EGR33066.1 hypothetical protein IMG5_062440 [Ichthyophthirius multifiliis]|eukprot:XP_004037052.1 hypothetical protein IMG5_062440 [Ichthyophthirius multifiliis]